MLRPQTRRRLQRVTLQPHQVTPNIQIGLPIALTSEQRHYLCNVLRLETNAEFIALDRQGGWWLAKLSNINGVNGEAIAEVVAELDNDTELSISVSVGVAMPKGNNMESIVRQATELGVRQIAPLFSDRTVIKSGTDIGHQKRDRWQRIAEESAELSLRNYVPEIIAPINFEQWLAKMTALPQEVAKYICVTHSDVPHLWTSLQNNCSAESSQIAIATGCEGGWTAREEEIAITAGFSPVSLGDRVLSAVTAPVVALSIVGAFLDTN